MAFLAQGLGGLTPLVTSRSGLLWPHEDPPCALWKMRWVLSGSKSTKYQGSTKSCLEKGRTGDTLECQAPMVKEFVWQFSLWCPCVSLWIIAVQGIQVLDGIVWGETSSSCDIQLVPDDSGPMMHSSVLHVCTFNKLVAFCIISNYSPGVPWMQSQRWKRQMGIKHLLPEEGTIMIYFMLVFNKTYYSSTQFGRIKISKLRNDDVSQECLAIFLFCLSSSCLIAPWQTRLDEHHKAHPSGNQFVKHSWGLQLPAHAFKHLKIFLFTKQTLRASLENTETSGTWDEPCCVGVVAVCWLKLGMQQHGAISAHSTPDALSTTSVLPPCQWPTGQLFLWGVI